MTTKNSVFEIFRPDNSALLLIDHQIGTMQLIKTQPLAHVKQLTIALAKAAAVLRHRASAARRSSSRSRPP